MWAQIKGIAGGFAAGFLAYIVVGGLLGIMLATSFSERVDCWPNRSVFGVIGTTCSSAFVEALSFGAVELPRMALVFPSVAIGMFDASLRNTTGSYFFEGVWWTILSTPILLIVGLGFRHWKVSSPAVAWILLVFFAIEAVVIAIGE